MRLFIAINWGDETRTQLLALRDELSSRSEYGRYSAPENLHLTLVFLGECDVKQAAAAKAAMDETKFEPFPITMERVGRFKRSGGDIWWAEVKQSKALADLQADLADKLIASGFALEKRKYSPHITIGREVITSVAPWRVYPFGETVTSIELMKSERIAGKLTYTPIYKKEGEQTN